MQTSTHKTLQSSATTDQPPKTAKKIFKWEGVKPIPFLAVLVLGAFLWYLPVPEGLTSQAWHLFAIFVCTIIAIILKPLPMGAVAIVAIAVCTITGTLTISQSLSSFSNRIVWLVVIAFFIAQGFTKTGLGSRIAYFFISTFGRKTIGLSYSLVLTDFLLSPMIPSNTARGGGVIFPIILSLADGYGSRPSDGTQRKIGAFLLKVSYQANIITCSMFMTAMAGNPLIILLALGAGVNITWGGWALATIVPGVIALILMPLVLYKLYPPELKDTPDAPKAAQQKLKEMGPLTPQELIMLGTFVLLITFWIFGSMIGIGTVTTALLGFSILLLSGVLKWRDILEEKEAWSTLIWFAALLMMASFLTKFGMMQWFSNIMQSATAGYSWLTTVAILGLVYFYVHYLFASMTAHITSLYSAFLLVMIGAGAPPMAAAMGLAVLSSLCAGLTHYGAASAPVYFGAGYIRVQDWWRLGAIVALLNLVIWLTVGAAWWKLIGIL